MKKLIALLIALCMVLMMVPIGKVSAAVSVVIQTRLATDSATINWSKVAGATEYYLGIGESKDDAEKAAKEHSIVVDSGTINYTFTGLKPGMNLVPFISFGATPPTTWKNT